MKRPALLLFNIYIKKETRINLPPSLILVSFLFTSITMFSIVIHKKSFLLFLLWITSRFFTTYVESTLLNIPYKNLRNKKTETWLQISVLLKMKHRGFEPRTTWLKVKCSTDWANAPWKMPRAGIEPATRGFSVLCSTNWAIWAWVAGTGFEPVTFGLWARRASRLLHPAIFY